jgi:predicted house-cleaning noncanonical NTP pyrophosphatase (MazG superfamily)
MYMKNKIRILNKLGRNKIHENLAHNGEGIAITRVLSQEEYQTALYNKLKEEVGEFLETPIPEELADILEVIYALAPLIAGSVEQLEKIRAAKAEVRGGFDKRLFIHEIHEK